MICQDTIRLSTCWTWTGKSWPRKADIGSRSRPEKSIPPLKCRTESVIPWTLHDDNGKRILGFDNAHAAPKEGGRFAARRVEYDRWHPDGRQIRTYEFSDAGKLLEDFFAAVDRLLKERGVT